MYKVAAKIGIKRQFKFIIDNNAYQRNAAKIDNFAID